MCVCVRFEMNNIQISDNILTSDIYNVDGSVDIYVYFGGDV